MVSLHKPKHTSVMNIIKRMAIRQRLCRSIGSVVWLVKTNYLSARYTLMGFGPTLEYALHNQYYCLLAVHTRRLEVAHLKIMVEHK